MSVVDFLKLRPVLKYQLLIVKSEQLQQMCYNDWKTLNMGSVVF